LRSFRFSKNFLLIFLPVYGVISINFFDIFLSRVVAEQNYKTQTLENSTVKEELISEDIYILGPGDVLALQIYDVQEYSKPTELKILNDGHIIAPFVGSIKVSGLTLMQAEILIESRLNKELIQPSISLKLIEERPIRVGIYGEINRPGIYVLGKSNSANNFTILDAIQKAGGVTPYSNLRNVSIKRRLPGEEDEFKIAKLDILSALIDGQLSQNVLLFDGDSINLSKANSINSDSEIVSNTNAASEKILVSVVGGVLNPGQITLKNGSTLKQAILFAGGPVNFKSNLSNIQLIRINQNGTISSTKHKFSYSKSRNNSKNPILKEGDIIRVPESFLSKTGEAITTVGTPIFLLDRLVNSVGDLID